MSTDVAPLSAVQDQIKDRIKAEFVTLIPDDMWERMVAGVIKEFITDTTNRYNSAEASPSPLKKMIRDELEALAKKKIQEGISELSTQTWDGYGQRAAGEAIKLFVDKNMPELLASTQKNMVMMIVQMAVDQLRNSMYR